MPVRAIALFVAGLALGLGGVLSASAESATTRPSPGQVEKPDPGKGAEAPVGHRQPHAKDVAPAEMPPADQATREFDKALAKKLTICRGC